MSKRYVLLMAEANLTGEDTKKLMKMLGSRYGKVKLIPVDENPKAVVVKTTNAGAPLFRESISEIMLNGKKLQTVLTSGSIGRLKRRAGESRTTASGEVSKR